MNPVFVILIIVLSVFLIIGTLILISKMRGNIKILLNKTQFAPGEEVIGKATLTLKKPTEAKFLRVGLIGVRKTREYSGRGSTTRNQKVFEFYQDIDTNKVYSGVKDYPFSIKIPSNIIAKLDNPIGKAILGVVSALTGVSNQVKWYIVSELEISGFNISKKVQINIY